MNFTSWIYALLLFCVCVEALRFPGSVDGRIRKCLLAGLKRLHSNSAPLKTSLNDPETFAFLSRYPAEIKQLFFEYLDYKSIKKLSQCNKKAARFTVPIIAQKLASFNPHFVFDDELVNSLLLAVLDKHFPNSKYLQSETIHDELQLLIMKYSRDDLNFDSIPKNIYFYLISFINEAVHGVDAIFDHSAQTFCILLLKFKIPKSYSYFRQFIADNVFINSPNVLWKHHLDFFSQNPSKDEVRRHFEIPAGINDWVILGQIHDVFYRVILELFYDEFTDESVVELYKFHLTRDFRSHVSLNAFIRRYFSLVDEDELSSTCNSPFYSNFTRYIICTELSVRFGKTIDTCYFSSRNSINELSLDRLAFFDNETIFKQLKRYNPKNRICDLEFIENVMNSDFLVSPKFRVEILTYFVHVQCYDIVELMVKETIQPINFFEYRSYNFYTPLTNFIGQLPEKIVLEFVHSVNDPLICLMILYSNFSLEAKRIAQQKNFNMNRIYRFDFETEIGVCTFVGREMHFKQILKELNDPKLNEAFRFNSTDLNHDYSTIDESLPVVIVDEYYTFTLNSH
jgi:hypothetical protein